MNMNSKMTVTFPLNRTGSFALQFSTGLLTQVSIILFSLGFFLFCCQSFKCSCDYHITIAITAGLSVSVNMTKGQISSENN